jgi:hypothetical protein
MIRKLLVAAIARIALVATAEAATIAGGPLFRGTGETQATCYLYNSGGAAVPVTSAKIVDEQGNSLTLGAIAAALRLPAVRPATSGLNTSAELIPAASVSRAPERCAACSRS